MKTSKDILRTVFSSGSLSEGDGLFARTGYFLGSFLVSISIITGFVYLLSFRLTGSQPDILDFYRLDIITCLVIICIATTVGVGYMAARLVGWLFPQGSNEKMAEVPETGLEHDVSVTTHQLLHLKRGAERLNNVEQNLVRQLSGEHQVDIVTHQLLTEMCVCTNRLIGQLSDLNTDNPQLASRTALYNRHDKIPTNP